MHACSRRARVNILPCSTALLDRQGLCVACPGCAHAGHPGFPFGALPAHPAARGALRDLGGVHTPPCALLSLPGMLVYRRGTLSC